MLKRKGGRREREREKEEDYFQPILKLCKKKKKGVGGVTILETQRKDFFKKRFFFCKTF